MSTGRREGQIEFFELHFSHSFATPPLTRNQISKMLASTFNKLEKSNYSIAHHVRSTLHPQDTRTEREKNSVKYLPLSNFTPILLGDHFTFTSSPSPLTSSIFLYF